MIRCSRNTGSMGKLSIFVIATIPTFVNAQQNFDIDVTNTGAVAAIQQDSPGYPGDKVRRGQEGWVRMSYVVTAEGGATAPIILNSSGGRGFEYEARKALPEWRFEARTSESPYNIVNIRSEINRGRDAATSNFIRRTKRILMHLHSEEIAAARKQVDDAYNMGGWNLYESTMLWMMLGRVDGAEGNNAGKLEMYMRALEVGNNAALPADDRVELLEKIFLLQSHFQHHAAALRTVARLKKLKGHEPTLQRIADRAAGIEQILATENVTSASATISNPCDCDDGEPLWHYVPARRTFSFANTNGNVERFEARCEGQRISGAVELNKFWSLAPEWGFCRVIVFGGDGATFDFLEHLSDDDQSASPSSVARNYVLDKRSRSQ